MGLTLPLPSQGTEDPRLLSAPSGPNGAAEPWLLFHTRAHFSRAGVACQRLGATQADDPDAAAYTVTREQGLQPYMVPLRLGSAGDSSVEVRASRWRVTPTLQTLQTTSQNRGGRPHAPLPPHPAKADAPC